MPSKKSADDFQVSQALRAFEGQALVYASRFIPDATVRREYIGRAQDVSRSTRQLYTFNAGVNGPAGRVCPEPCRATYRAVRPHSG